MDGARVSPSPHYSWIAYWLTIDPPRVFGLHECRHVTHRLLLTTEGAADVEWRTKGSELRFHAGLGDLAFFPCDHAEHALSFTTAARYRAFVLCLPEGQLPPPGGAAERGPSDGFHAIPVFRDALMHASLVRLSGAGGRHPVSAEAGDEIAARHVLVRLAEVAGGRVPEWPRDTSVFAAAEMRHIVDRIDARVARPASLRELSADVGLSAGHFARKFEHSAGVSLNRFVNRRRIGIAIGLLATGKVPLSQLSIDLGFSSQSHFTRTFRSLVGITPWQFRRMQSCPRDVD